MVSVGFLGSGRSSYPLALQGLDKPNNALDTLNPITKLLGTYASVIVHVRHAVQVIN